MRQAWLIRFQSLFLLSIAYAAAAAAQIDDDSGDIFDISLEQLETIVVVARKREESLQDVPLPITAFSGGFLEKMQIRNVRELMDFAPSLNVAAGMTLRDSAIAVRGIGSNGMNAGIGGSVGLYLDGVYIPRQAGLINRLADIQTLELLRGPQGTLYGVNTPAGLLNVNTRRPTEQAEGQVSVGFGNFDSTDFSGFVSGPITNDLAGRLTFWDSGNDGTTRTVLHGRTNSFEETGARVKLLWAPSDRREIELIADYTTYDSQCCDGEWVDISREALETFERMAQNLGLDRSLIFPSRTGDGYAGRGEKIDHVSFADGDGRESFDHWGVSVNASFDVFGRHTLDVIAAARRWESDQLNDQDELGADFSYFPNQIEDQDTYSVEVRLNSPTGQFFEYVAGAFLYWNESEFVQQTRLLAPLCLYTRNTQGRVASGAIADTTEARSGCVGWWRHDSWTQDWSSYALFAEGTFNLTDRFDVALGARVTRDDKSADKVVRQFGGDTPQNDFGAAFGTNSFADDVDNTETTWSVTARYFLRDRPVMLFARAAKGYKAPGINARPIRVPTIPRAFGPEESINTEVGIKSKWLDNRVLINLTLYRNNFDDLQQVAANPAADPTGVLGTFVQNAGELEHTGAELEFQWQVNDWLALFGSAAYLDSEFKEFRGTPCAADGFSSVPRDVRSPSLCDQTGLSNTFAPQLRHNTSVEVRLPVAGTMLEWFARWSAIYTDEQHTAADRDVRAIRDDYWLHNMSAGLGGSDGRWEIKAWAKNITDKRYKQFGFDGNIPAFFGTRGSFVAYLGEPRSYGVNFTYRFL